MFIRTIFEYVFLFELIVINPIQSVDDNNSGFDDDIMRYLLTNKSYNNLARPTSQVNVGFSISYRQLVSLDERSGLMTSNFYLSATCMIQLEFNLILNLVNFLLLFMTLNILGHDHRLEWNPLSFSNMSHIVISARRLWLPDFAVINTAHTSVFIPIIEPNLAIINSAGNVYLKLSVNGLQTRCQTNVYRYPFDAQNCSIQIGSWQLDSTRINFSSDSSKIDTKDFLYSTTWDLLGVYTGEIYSASRYPYLGLKSDDIYFHVIIKRKPLYFMLTFVPCYILNVATLLAFFVTNAIVVQVNLCIKVLDFIY